MSANHGSDFIWATFDENVSEQTCDVYAQTTAEGFVEPPLRYRRADLPPTDAEVLAHPTVKALVEAANDICLIAERDEWHKAMTGRQIILRNLRAALAAIQEAKP